MSAEIVPFPAAVSQATEALRVAKEHLRWCGMRGISGDEVLRSVGVRPQGNRRNRRVVALAALWMQLGRF